MKRKKQVRNEIVKFKVTPEEKQALRVYFGKYSSIRTLALQHLKEVKSEKKE